MKADATFVNKKVIGQHMTDDRGSSAGGRQRYHHGDLRRHLLRVAREEIVRHGANRVSLASLARLAGVSQPAPYRHFADRDALLQAVAAEGFDEFGAVLTNAIATLAAPDALRAIAFAYVAFGESNIEIYRLMFASRLTPQAEPGSELDRASGQAFELLRAAIAAIAASGNVDDDAYLLWARLHGLVMLKADGFLARPLGQFVELFDALEGVKSISAKNRRNGSSLM